MEATAGDAKILRLPARDARNYAGYLTQQFSLYPDLSVDENIYYSAGLRLVPEDQLDVRRSKYLKLMQLDSFRDHLAGRLSGGMKQKLAPNKGDLGDLGDLGEVFVIPARIAIYYQKVYSRKE